MSNEEEIKIVDLGEREVATLTRFKSNCVVCKKETNQELIFVYEKEGRSRGLLFFGIIGYLADRSGRRPEFFGTRCLGCGYTTQMVLDVNKKGEMTARYHTDSVSKNKEQIKVIIVNYPTASRGASAVTQLNAS